MALITMIAAIGKNGELGKDDDLIWKIKEDLQFFKNATLNKKIVMGKKTFLSLPGLLEGRVHIVITTSDELDNNEEIIVFKDFNKLLEYLNTLDEEVMIIGGASIYNEFMKFSDKMLLTIIDESADADVYFPKINEEEWDITNIYDGKFEETHYTRKMYIRK